MKGKDCKTRAFSVTGMAIRSGELRSRVFDDFFQWFTRANYSRKL
jgi:hypothetical protein